MDIVTLGRRFLFFGMALMTGLFIGWRLLQAHAPETRSRHTADDLRPQQISLEAELMQSIRDNLTDLYWKKGENFSLSLPEVRQVVKGFRHNGKPFAIIASKELYVADRRGRILAPLDSMASVDRPVITGDDFLIDMKSGRLTGGDMEDALLFLRLVDLPCEISELHLGKRGLVAYLKYGRDLPVILGRGSIERKCEYLEAFFLQLGPSPLARRAKYLDLRIEGQIIVKENT
jgi:hypothetical protein